MKLAYKLCTAVFGLAVGCVIAAPAALADNPAGWRPFEEGVYEVAAADDGNLVLDVSNASTDEGANVIAWRSGDVAQQKWAVTFDSLGRATLRSLISGKVLTADNDQPSANVTVRELTGAANQQWSIEVQDDGAYCLYNPIGRTALAIGGYSAAAGENVHMALASDSSNERFTFKKTAPLPDGVYTLLFSNSNLAFDVPNGTTDPSASIQVWSSNNGLAQKWLATRQSDDTYTFEALTSGLLLTATGYESGANVVQAPANSTNTQRFYLEPTAGGGFQLRVKGTSCAIDLSGGVFNNGTNVQIWDANGTPAQMVRFAATEPLPSGYYTIGMASDPRYQWDVADGKVTTGANLQIWEHNGGYAQTFEVTGKGGDVYEIGLCGIDPVIAPVNGSAALSATIQQCDQNNAAKRWKISYAGGRSFTLTNTASNLVADVAGGWVGNGANVQLYVPNGTPAQRFVFLPTSYIEPPVYHGFQNPAGYYQVSSDSVWFPHLGEGIFGYRTESRISKSATRNDCVEAMIGRAYDYLGTPYVWDYACAPGVGVDCAGLVLQCLYATGMDLSPMNPWDHYYTPGHDHYAGWMASSDGFQSVSFSQRQRGDLIFYSGHVAIYLCNDQILDAYPPQVMIANIYSRGTIIGVGRPYIG